MVWLITLKDLAHLFTQTKKAPAQGGLIENNHAMIEVAQTFTVEMHNGKAGPQGAGIDAENDSRLQSPHETIQTREKRVVKGKSFEPPPGLGHDKFMSKVSPETIRNYEKQLKKDPNSKVFAPLADAYREEGRLEEAEILVRDGIQRHPQYVGGYLTLARILLSSKRAAEAEESLKKAVQVSPENLLAYQLLGQVYVELKRPMEALKAHKMVLFLNPLSEKSRQAVEKLETLSATDYEDDLFEMRPLKESAKPPKANLKDGLERTLSFVDALIVRNDLSQAKGILRDLAQRFPDNKEINRRWAFFDEDGDEPLTVEEPLRPLMKRERMIWERKKQLLEAILERIRQHRDTHLLVD